MKTKQHARVGRIFSSSKNSNLVKTHQNQSPEVVFPDQELILSSNPTK